MKSYKDVLNTVEEAKTITAHITALGKIRPNTEDQVLLDKIDKAISSLQKAHAQAKIVKSGPIPIYLDKATDPAVKDLVDHCKQAVKLNKPEWQTIAERNNWAPKT